MPKPYYLLLARDGDRTPWGIEFGDYDRQTVIAERVDYRSHYRAKDLMVVKAANATQAACNAAVAQANA